MDINGYISSGIIELYVLGLCSPEEAKELEQLRRQYPSLNDAILQYEIELEKNMQKNSILPGPLADEKILTHLESLQPPVINIDQHKKITGKINRLKLVAASAILLLGVSVFFNYTLYKKTKRQSLNNNNPATLPSSDYAILNNPSITPVALYGVGIHAICRCTLFWDKKTGKAYIIIHHLPKSSSVKDYQIWAEVNGKPVNLGIINDEIRGRFIEVSNVPAGAIAFTVTLEKAGGSDTPTVNETYLAGRI